MRSARRWVVPSLLLAAIASCDRADRMTGPKSPGPFASAASILDGRHGGGGSHFFFLPPTVVPQTLPPPPFTGTFDGTVTTAARVCVGTGPCAPGSAIASFTPTGGTGGSALGKIRVTPALQSYSAIWDTRQCVAGPCTLDPTQAYRLHVYATNAAGADAELGFADVTVVPLPKPHQPPPSVDLNNYSPLLQNLPYIIAFRIEQGVVGAVTVSPVTNTLAAGATQQLTAVVTDLHGATLTGRVVTWASSNTGVATVDANGVQTAAAAGTATITATSESQSGTASVTVSQPVINMWTTKASMPTARIFLGASVVNGVLYAVGGFDYAVNFSTAAVEAYDPVANSWTEKAPMPTPINSFGTGVVNGILYAVGGTNNGGIYATVEAYDPSTNTWTTKAPMHTARYGLAVSVVNGILYAVGGYNGSSVVATVEAYDPVADAWTTKTSLPTARFYLSSGVIGGIVYAVGGSLAPGSVGTVEAYDAVSNTWTAKAPLPTGWNSFSTAVVNGTLYAIGGSGSGTVEAFDPVTNAWTAKASLPTPRYGTASDVINNVVYTVGGNSWFGGTTLTTNEAYQP